jgi:phosphate:Na+ symporter
MTRLGRESIHQAFEAYRREDLKGLENVKRREDAIDTLQHDVTAYLVELSQRTLTDEESQLLPLLMHCVNDLERVGDQAENIGELAERRVRQKVNFSPESDEDLQRLVDSVDDQFRHLAACLERRSVAEAALVSECEGRTDRLVQEIDERHVKRLEEGKCDLRAAMMFRDMTAFLERVGDHLNNVAKRLSEFIRTQ